MNRQNAPSILQKTETFESKYLWADEFSEAQSNIFWTANEINVEKDKHCILINMTEAERNAVIDVLKLFTLYELKAGSDYWLGRFMRTFKRPELQRMAATFGFFELGVHKPFYAKLNEVLSLGTDEFLMSYKEDTILNDHMQFIGDMIRHENNLVSLAAFSMVEGAVLYSSFAFLKHFQSVGKNKLINVVRGINFSVRDEACLVEGTEVLTDEGWKNIETVEVSENVLCYDVDGTSRFSSVLNTTKVESSTSYEFTSPDFHQRVTGPHRMITPSGEVKAADAPENADYINRTGKNVNISTDLTVGADSTDAEFMYFIDHASHAALERALDELKPNQNKTDTIKCKLAKDKNYVTAKKSKIEKKNVENFHCLTVDTGAFFIRSHGKVSVTGNCHSEAGAKTFKVLKEELQLPRVHQAGVDAMIYEIADVLFKHEEYIVEKIFSHGEIEGVTEKQLLNFVKSRIDLCLRQLGYEGVHNVKYNPIADWFYDGISGFMFNDTFSGIGNSYVRNWDEDAFVYEEFKEKELEE